MTVPIPTSLPDTPPRPAVVSPDVARLADRLRPATPPERPLKIFFWPADLHSGCYVYRIKIVGDELARLGHEVQVSQRMSPWAREEADIIVGQRVAPLKPSTMWQLVCAERTRNGKGGMVYEVDDDLFNIDPKTNPMADVFKYPAIRQNMIDNLRAANLVTVTTGPLADVLRRHNPNVAILPNAVRREVFDIPAPDRRGRPDGPVVYGWQGSPTHADDWRVAEPAVVELLTTDDMSRLRFLGTPYWGALLAAGVDRRRVDALGWTPDLARHYGRVARFDVSLAPLADTKFNRSKSALRAQESLALGVPVVASDVPAYRGWVEHGRTGYLVKTRAQWVAAMRELQDPTLRLVMGRAGRQAAVAWTIEATAHRWVEAYRALL